MLTNQKTNLIYTTTEKYPFYFDSTRLVSGHDLLAIVQKNFIYFYSFNEEESSLVQKTQIVPELTSYEDVLFDCKFSMFQCENVTYCYLLTGGFIGDIYLVDFLDSQITPLRFHYNSII